MIRLDRTTPLLVAATHSASGRTRIEVTSDAIISAYIRDISTEGRGREKESRRATL